MVLYVGFSACVCMVGLWRGPEVCVLVPHHTPQRTTGLLATQAPACWLVNLIARSTQLTPSASAPFMSDAAIAAAADDTAAVVVCCWLSQVCWQVYTRHVGQRTCICCITFLCRCGLLCDGHCSLLSGHEPICVAAPTTCACLASSTANVR